MLRIWFVIDWLIDMLLQDVHYKLDMARGVSGLNTDLFGWTCNSKILIYCTVPNPRIVDGKTKYNLNGVMNP